ncbi:RagB/SusD family nutrient uptake outer membrane protein [Terrimonas sp. NA20]|uniref:RagB/SusD family nutrient uptake outer membrane protein n=1 Tax=Terrimonas ginsenosidimutans TaxID=2908004 RepID=A0ABS9KMD2_9BACT|nr:RagB/SusD family nutrient uptake outer membrane protein [Terrimonas ginsenosidimutans]MCG2613482.1 RagB/SusD family nutrient uptake outer membrane protein [Terrimonas ginsenosidimutans]
MKKILSILILAGLVLSISSCKKDFLEKKPLDSYSDADLWKDLNLVEAFVNSRYTILPYMESSGVIKSYFMSGACDEGNSKHSYGNERALETGQMGPDNTVYDFWTANYQQIRNLNIFLSKVDEVPAQGPTNEAKKKRLTGEVYFLRAYGYFDLLRHYGGVPLISKVYGLSDTTFKVARNTFEEGVAFVLSDIAKAIDLLPANYASDVANTGRVTATAAKALKSRLLLYAASTLHNPANDQAKWQAASTAAKEAIDFAENNGYALFQGADYKNIFVQKNNQEVLLAYNFSNVPGGGIDIVCQPNSYGGWSVYTPSQAMVDAFEMTNGKPITDPASGYDATNPYVNRDPRFYADVLYNGAIFKGTGVEVFAGGKDSPQGPQGWNATETGYHWRKYMSETIDMNKEGSNQNMIIFRLAELYLNYAEAEQALGRDIVAREFANKIRSRASVNMPAITESSAALRDRIRAERRVELCFESHRIYDVRRWKIASVTENKPLMGVTVTKSGSTITYTPKVVRNRVFREEYYLWPISRAEMNKNPLLVNNPGYN